MFALEENTHCPLFFSLTTALLGGDTLLSCWPKGWKYAFPPVKVMPLVLQNIREERHALLLVVPKWPHQPWFLELVNLSSAPLWDLLSQARSTIRVSAE